MNPINLVNYAEQSLKVPSEFLAPNPKKQDWKIWKLFLGHYIDFFSAFIFTIIISGVFNNSIKTMLVTKGLQRAWTKDFVIFTFSGSVLPTMLFCYFFFSYFLNDGQTWGMYLLKKRIRMKDKCFKEAALWACSSMVLCFSLGLSYFIHKEKWQNIKSYDYLYDHLMLDKDVAPINLLSEIAKFNYENPEKIKIKKTFSEAA
jgi:hypothetical protein